MKETSDQKVIGPTLYNALRDQYRSMYPGYKKGDWLLDEHLDWCIFHSYCDNRMYINVQFPGDEEIYAYQRINEYRRPRPILFSTDMVRANIDRRKTQTRRTFSPKLVFNDDPDRYKFHGFNDDHEALFEDLRPDITPWMTPVKCPYGQPGDILYVRETWGINEDEKCFVYKSTDPDWQTTEGWRWRPSIHMPRQAARLFLKIEEVKVQRLHDITETDAINEGIPNGAYAIHPVYSFSKLWDEINKDRADWQSNPWVWAITYVTMTNDQ